MLRFHWTALPLILLLAGCMADTQTTPSLADRLADREMVLTGVEGVDPAAGPMRMTLRRDGTGQMAYAGLDLTYKWQTRGANDLCLTDLRLSGMPSDDTRAQCSRVTIEGDRVTVQGLGPEQKNRRMSGTIRPI